MTSDSVVKRDVQDDAEDLADDLRDTLPKGATCLTDDQCPFIQYCDHSQVAQLVQPNCQFQTWFIVAIAAVAVALLISLIVSCLCCPCCCLYSLCRKG